MISEDQVRETLQNLQGQHDRLQKELWALEGAMAVCIRLLQAPKEDQPADEVKTDQQGSQG